VSTPSPARRAPPRRLPSLPTGTEPAPARRALTAGERSLAARAFGDALALDPIRINRLKWWMWQPAWITMAPDGHLWFHPNGDVWSADFSTERLPLRAHFVHELTHVWQHQSGVNLLLRRPPFARYRYLPLVEGRPFGRYGLEQQAEMVKDAWLLAQGVKLAGRPPLDVYRALLPFPIG
jgi:hypothetical protein